MSTTTAARPVVHSDLSLTPPAPVASLPKATTGELDPATTQTVISCSLVVVILAVTPWPYVWRNYVRATGDRWR